jgi:DNA-binding MurR/RpiR family transcriptional regulator
MLETDFIEQLNRDFASYTAAGQRIASYLLTNLHQLPFETADGIATQTGMAGITVGRFLRSIGFRNLDDLKRALRSGRPLLVTDRLGSFRAHSAQEDALEQSLAHEIKAIESTYALTRTPPFRRVVERTADAEAVFLFGIQSTRGIVNSLFCHLEYIRPRVYYVDGLSGTYAESLNSEFKDPYLIIADLSTYSVMTRRLVAAACQRKLGAAFVCDKYCSWAGQYPIDLIQLDTDVGQFWDSVAPMCVLFNLIASGVVARLGAKVDERLLRHRVLQQEMGQFEF